MQKLISIFLLIGGLALMWVGSLSEVGLVGVVITVAGALLGIATQVSTWWNHG
ncbi:MAG: hypothetical protein NTV12_02605 [Verrucomicrobia bacterium]|nr:hypothetical protein [Verrucomicrobiota bacterium]